MPRMARVVIPGVPHHPPSPRGFRLRRGYAGQDGGQASRSVGIGGRMCSSVTATVSATWVFSGSTRRAGVVERAEEYPWSSAAGHCGRREDPLLSGNLEWSDQITDWSAWLAEEEDPATLARLRLLTRTGRPAGDETFVDRLESLLGRILRPRSPGRPRKETKCG